MTTKDAIQSIDKSTEAIRQSIESINKTLQAINETNIYHLEFLKSNAKVLEKTNDNWKKNTDRLGELIAQNRAFLKIFYLVVIALVILAGVEKGIKIWDLVR